MGTPSWRVALRWFVGALVATALTTIGPAPLTSPPEDSTASGPSGDAAGSTAAGDVSSSVAAATPITFPTAETAGLPAGWSPRRTHTGDLWIRTAGTVVEDLRITDGVIHVAAQDVTLRRVHAVGAKVVNDAGDTCGSGLVVEESLFVAGSAPTHDTDLPVIGNGGFTVRDVVIDGVPEGIRVGAKQCGDVVVEDSFVRITPPDVCPDWHGDGIQGYGGGSVTVRRTWIIMREREDCSGTAPFFYPSGQGNTSLTIDGLLVEGGGYPFRAGTPGTVRDLQVVRDSWGYGPVDVLCSALTSWQAHVVTVSDGLTTPGAAIECTGSGT
ncbi:hypothetical protein ACFS27_27005 [Promicromonospora vindobonensis]|uniref:Uncharacterized protein n=1 Tax=Promicromonospora vindobonensis TaxID=195748 RepID=A0ABW5W0C9_9MICO